MKRLCSKLVDDNFPGVESHLDQKGANRIKKISEFQKSARSVLDNVIKFLFFFGCLIIGILAFNLVPSEDDSCKIDTHQCTFAFSGSVQMTATCQVNYEAKNSDKINSTPKQCFENYITRKQIGDSQQSVYLLVALTMGIPIILTSLVKYSWQQQQKNLILQLWDSEKFDNIKNTYFYISTSFYVLALILYSLALWRVFKNDFAGMAIMSVVVAGSTLFAYFSYKCYTDQYIAVAKSISPKCGAKPTNPASGTQNPHPSQKYKDDAPKNQNAFKQKSQENQELNDQIKSNQAQFASGEIQNKIPHDNQELELGLQEESDQVKQQQQQHQDRGVYQNQLTNQIQIDD